MNNRLLSEKWVKASIAGTIWAASEIVLGSFLHNPEVPFSGNLLTAIGVIILISLGHKLTDRKELARMREKNDFMQKIFILTGATGNGKTSCVQQIVITLKEKKREEFLRVAGKNNSKDAGEYFIIRKGLQLGLNALNISDNFDNKLVVIDEVGHLELKDRGWAHKLSYLLKSSNNHLLLVIRESLLGEAIQKWSLQTPVVF